MNWKTIRADQVQVGDVLWSGDKTRGRGVSDTVRVVEVRERADGQIVIITTGYETWKDPREGVAVQRD